MEKEDRSLWLILAGIAVFSLWYTLSRRTENALWLVLAAICIVILAYRLYGTFIAERAALLSNEAAGPARLATDAWLVFAYQFASTAGVGLLVGPVLAAQFGYLPGYLWVLVAAVLGGALSDLAALVLSRRRGGAFLPVLVGQEVGPWSGLATWGIVAVALPLFLAVTGALLFDVLARSPWAVYTLAVTVVVALLVAAYEAWLRPGRLGEAVAIGVGLCFLAMVAGARIPAQQAGSLLSNRGIIAVLVAVYCLVSAVLPLGVLGRARGLISGHVLLIGVVVLAAGIAFGAPALRQPATSQFVSGGGPLVTGGAVPYLMILITSGAICGFNALVATALTSRMLKQERDALPVGYGSLLVQGLLVVLVLVSVSTLRPWDYYAMNSTAPLGEIERIAGNGQRDWDALRSTLRVENPRDASGLTTVAAAAAWTFRDVPGIKREWLPNLYRFMFVVQALLLLAGLEALAHVGRAGIEEVSDAALRTPLLAGMGGNRQGRLGLVVGGSALLTAVWLVLALKADVPAVLPLLAFTSLVLAGVVLGTALGAWRGQSRWSLAVVGVPLVVVIALACIVGLVTVRDSARLLDRPTSLAEAYTTLPAWGAGLPFVNVDRSREVVRQWPAKEAADVFLKQGTAEAARQLQQRLGIGQAEAQKLADVIAARASGRSLWSWLQIVLTLLVAILGMAVAAGRFVTVPLQWPARRQAAAPLAPGAAATPLAATPSAQGEPPQSEPNIEYEI